MNAQKVVARIGFWGGMLVTTMVNFMSAPDSTLKFVYLFVPLTLACLTESLFLNPQMSKWIKGLVIVGSIVPAYLSWEHFHSLILSHGGTETSAFFTSFALDGTMFVCGIIAASHVRERETALTSTVSPASLAETEPVPSLSHETADETARETEPALPGNDLSHVGQSETGQSHVERVKSVYRGISFLNVPEDERASRIMEITGCSRSTAYRVLKNLLSEIEDSAKA